MRAVVEAFRGKIVERRTTMRYKLSLLATAIGLCLLVAAYVSLIGVVIFFMYGYATHAVPGTMGIRSIRFGIWAMLLHAAVLLSFLGILYSLISSIFSREKRRNTEMRLSPIAHPVLYCFVTALCKLIRAPQPDEIWLDFAPNAAAMKTSRCFGLFGRKFVLIIGGPLFYGLDLRALAGVISHELGHFSQSHGGRLTKFVVAIGSWFERAADRTSGIQSMIADHSEESVGGINLFVIVAYLITGIGQLLLKGFALASAMICYSQLRQQEFDADRYEAEVAGSGQFAKTFERLVQLNVGFANVLRLMMRNELDGDANANLFQVVVEDADNLGEPDLRRVARALKPQKAGYFDSHPSPADRIAAVAKNPQPGIFQLQAPALVLLNQAAISVTPWS